jgi:hypothetical protein
MCFLSWLTVGRHFRYLSWFGIVTWTGPSDHFCVIRDTLFRPHSAVMFVGWGGDTNILRPKVPDAGRGAPRPGPAFPNLDPGSPEPGTATPGPGPGASVPGPRAPGAGPGAPAPGPGVSQVVPTSDVVCTWTLTLVSMVKSPHSLNNARVHPDSANLQPRHMEGSKVRPDTGRFPLASSWTPPRSRLQMASVSVKTPVASL